MDTGAADAPDEAQPSGSGDPAQPAAQQPVPSAPSKHTQPHQPQPSSSSSPQQQQPSRYELQKRRDWNTFLQYLKNHRPPLTLARCSGANVIEFLKYLDQFGKTKVHNHDCNYFGHPNPPEPCPCPLKQAWGSLDALIGRLRAAYEENGGKPESNPFGAKAVGIYLREVRESQAKARGIPYEKKKRKRLAAAETSTAATVTVAAAAAAAAAAESSAATGAQAEAAAAAAGGRNGDQGEGSDTPSPTPTPPPPLPPTTASSS